MRSFLKQGFQGVGMQYIGGESLKGACFLRERGKINGKKYEKIFFIKKRFERLIFATEEKYLSKGKNFAHETPPLIRKRFLSEFFYFETALRDEVVSRVAR